MVEARLGGFGVLSGPLFEYLETLQSFGGFFEFFTQFLLFVVLVFLDSFEFRLIVKHTTPSSYLTLLKFEKYFFENLLDFFFIDPHLLFQFGFPVLFFGLGILGCVGPLEAALKLFHRLLVFWAFELFYQEFHVCVNIKAEDGVNLLLRSDDEIGRRVIVVRVSTDKE